jgi:hypothetical protein
MSRRTTTAAQCRKPLKRVWVYSAIAAMALSMVATAIVLANVIAGVPRQSDENASAHLFQLAIAAQLPLFVMFLAFADWAQRRRALRLIVGQFVAVTLALGALAWSRY